LQFVANQMKLKLTEVADNLTEQMN